MCAATINKNTMVVCHPGAILNYKYYPSLNQYQLIIYGHFWRIELLSFLCVTYYINKSVVYFYDMIMNHIILWCKRIKFWKQNFKFLYISHQNGLLTLTEFSSSIQSDDRKWIGGVLLSNQTLYLGYSFMGFQETLSWFHEANGKPRIDKSLQWGL